MRFNADAQHLFERCVEYVEALGPPVAILAWASVFLASVVLGYAVRNIPKKRSILFPALILGVISLTAHALDYMVTLRVSPTLAEEVNPIWRIVVNNYGLQIAKAYGLTGKILVSVIGFELFAFYLAQREKVSKERAGKWHTIRWQSILNLFCFAFAMTGPFYFYVAFMNSRVDSPTYFRLPSLPLALSMHLALVLAAYVISTPTGNSLKKSGSPR